MNRTRENLRVWVSGRWGRRRVRTTECRSVVTSETLYDRLLRDGKAPRPGLSGRVVIGPPVTAYTLTWDSVPNRIWAFGRIFLTCPGCDRRATRLYIPLAGCRPECRSCWGLSYTSRTRVNYKRSGSSFWRAVGISSSDWARLNTEERRREAKTEALERYRSRRPFTKIG